MDDDTTHFTSDHHFGHRNILRYCERPFPDVETMDDALIRAWNHQVGPDDVVYHLGDFTLKGRSFARQVFSALRGRIHVLGYPWHHDQNWVPSTYGPCDDLLSATGHPVVIEPPMVVLDLPSAGPWPQGLVLCHFPLARWDRRHHGAWHLHGHSHGAYTEEGAILDVGVDVHPYRPVSLGQIRRHFGGEAPPR